MVRGGRGALNRQDPEHLALRIVGTRDRGGGGVNEDFLLCYVKHDNVSPRRPFFFPAEDRRPQWG